MVPAEKFQGILLLELHESQWGTVKMKSLVEGLWCGDYNTEAEGSPFGKVILSVAALKVH